MTAHAKLFSPSAAHRWSVCLSAPRAEQGCPDSSSSYAEDGTAAHELGAICLTTDTNTAGYIGRLMSNGVEVTEEVAEYVQVYVDAVREYADGGELLVEQRVDFSNVIKQPDSFGTLDAAIVQGRTLIVIDAKFGKGVPVSAEQNEQMQLYALGELELLGDLLEFDEVTMVICQPRISWAPQEWTVTVEQLRAFGERMRIAAANVIRTFDDDELYAESFSPGEKTCMWCKAKAMCPALRNQVLTMVADDFVDESKPLRPQLEHAPSRTMDDALLGNLMGAVDLIEDFAKAIRAEAERRLLAGNTVPGWKLVEGRRGARAWTNDADVEEAMKSMRLRQDEMYDFKLISPTKAEKLLKKESPKRWAKLEELITQSEGKPSVAPASDKRPPLVVTAVADEFDSLV